MFLEPTSFFNQKYAFSLASLLVDTYKLDTIPLALGQFIKGVAIWATSTLNYGTKITSNHFLCHSSNEVQIFKINKRVIDTLILPATFKVYVCSYVIIYNKRHATVGYSSVICGPGKIELV